MTKPKSKKKKPVNYKKKAIELAKLISRSIGQCEYCGSINKQLQGSHILPERGYPGTAANPYGIICLCSTCHKWGRDSWHNNPILMARWFESKYPGRYDELHKLALDNSNPNWELVYNNLLCDTMVT